MPKVLFSVILVLVGCGNIRNSASALNEAPVYNTVVECASPRTVLQEVFHDGKMEDYQIEISGGIRTLMQLSLKVDGGLTDDRSILVRHIKPKDLHLNSVPPATPLRGAHVYLHDGVMTIVTLNRGGVGSIAREAIITQCR